MLRIHVWSGWLTKAHIFHCLRVAGNNHLLQKNSVLSVGFITGKTCSRENVCKMFITSAATHIGGVSQQVCARMCMVCAPQPEPNMTVFILPFRFVNALLYPVQISAQNFV